MFKLIYCLPCHLLCNTMHTSTKAVNGLPSGPALRVAATWTVHCMHCSLQELQPDSSTDQCSPASGLPPLTAHKGYMRFLAKPIS